MIISNTLKSLLISTSLTFLVSGCSTHIPVNKKVGHLNLENERFIKEEKVENVIAIVSPVFATHEEKEANDPMSYMQKLMAQRVRINADYNFQTEFRSNYAKRLVDSFESSLSEMISSKGFNLQGPYGTFDDMTYKEKKKVYLAFVPRVDLQIEQKISNTENHRLYTHQDGVIQIGGTLLITMVEPMTGEIFLKKRINLSDFNIQESYVFERQFRERSGGLDSALIDKATAPKIITDTTDIAMTKALNEFYSKAMKKINKYLDREEILSYEEDIVKLKGLKRF